MKKRISILAAMFLSAALVFAGCTKDTQKASDDAAQDSKESTEDVKDSDDTASEDEKESETKDEKETESEQADGSSGAVEEEYILMTSLLGVPGATAFESDYQETLKYYEEHQMGVCRGVNYVYEKGIFFVDGSFERYEGDSVGYFEGSTWVDNPKTFLPVEEREIPYAKDCVLTLSGGEAPSKRVGIDEFFDAAHAYNGLGLLLHIVNGTIVSADISS